VPTDDLFGDLSTSRSILISRRMMEESADFVSNTLPASSVAIAAIALLSSAGKTVLL
jgi:hypothetical protein